MRMLDIGAIAHAPRVKPHFASHACAHGAPSQSRNSNNVRSRGPGISGHPGTHHHARRGAAGDASPGARHLFGADVRSDRQPAARSRQSCSPPRARPTSTSPTATAPGRPRSPTCCRAATRCWCWRADASRSAGVRPRPLHGRRGRGAEGRLAPRGAARARSRRGWRATRTTASRPFWWRRSTPPRASSTTSRRSARRSRPRAIPRSTWSTPWPRSAACRSRWTTGASTSRCPARRRG